jgi:hypothetical protein
MKRYTRFFKETLIKPELGSKGKDLLYKTIVYNWLGKEKKGKIVSVMSQRLATGNTISFKVNNEWINFEDILYIEE